MTLSPAATQTCQKLLEKLDGRRRPREENGGLESKEELFQESEDRPRSDGGRGPVEAGNHPSPPVTTTAATDNSGDDVDIHFIRMDNKVTHINVDGEGSDGTPRRRSSFSDLDGTSHAPLLYFPFWFVLGDFQRAILMKIRCFSNTKRTRRGVGEQYASSWWYGE